MSGLRSLRQGSVHSSEHQFNNTCMAQIDFILANKNILIEKHRNGKDLIDKIESIKKDSPNFTPGQRAEVDRVYEVVMEKAGFGGFKPLLRIGDFKKHA